MKVWVACDNNGLCSLYTTFEDALESLKKSNLNEKLTFSASIHRIRYYKGISDEDYTIQICELNLKRKKIRREVKGSERKIVYYGKIKKFSA